jgi:hypothetical protein
LRVRCIAVRGVAAYIALSRWRRRRWRPLVLEGLVAQTEEESLGDLSGLAVEIDHCEVMSMLFERVG